MLIQNISVRCTLEQP